MAEDRYAPWLEVTRTLGFGVAWTVETRVRRVTPRGTPVAVRVPLLPGEAPTQAHLVVEDDAVAVSLGRDEVETRWESTLEQTTEIQLLAPEGQPWSEVWRLQCSAVWSCRADGLPPVRRVADGVFEPEYRPWPGESLQVALAHPAGVEGQTLTLDSVRLEASPGTRLERALLALQVRSSREQPLLLGLPEAAEVQQVSVDGSERPLRPEGGELRVTVPAGRHDVEVRWQQARGIGVAWSFPRVDLPGPAVNVTQQLTLPPSRWLLLTWGPAWGPAVLFWSYFIFLLAMALGLGRLSLSPLSSLQWVLLGLGLSQIPPLGALVVVGFVFALVMRQQRQPASAGVFDLMQLGLVAWAVVSLALLYAAIHTGLLFRPDMQVAGNGSSDTILRWYADRVTGSTPAAGVMSLPLWVYRVGMLVWALWLAAGLVRAIGWGWRAFGEGGLWRKLVLRRAPAAPPAAKTERLTPVPLPGLEVRERRQVDDVGREERHDVVDDLPLGEDADEGPVLVDDGNVAEPAHAHPVQREGHAVLEPQRLRLGGHDLFDGPVEPDPRGHHPAHQVALGEDPHGLALALHQNGAEPVLQHELDRRADGAHLPEAGRGLGLQVLDGGVENGLTEALLLAFVVTGLVLVGLVVLAGGHGHLPFDRARGLICL